MNKHYLIIIIIITSGIQKIIIAAVNLLLYEANTRLFYHVIGQLSYFLLSNHSGERLPEPFQLLGRFSNEFKERQ